MKIFDTADISKFEKLLTLLYNYESDEPYSKDETPLEWIPCSKILNFLNEEHYGDCNQHPCSCALCFAEQCKKKAEWILKRLDSKDGNESF